MTVMTLPLVSVSRVGYISGFYNENAWQQQLREKGFSQAHSLRAQASIVYKSWEQAPKTPGYNARDTSLNASA